MSTIQPYLRHTALLAVLIFCLISGIWVLRKCFKDEKFRMWLLASLSTDNIVSRGSSGKALSGFLFSTIIALASVVSFIWTPTHLMPDYMYISLLTFVAALYGIKMVGGKFGNGNSNGGGDNGNNSNGNAGDNSNAPATPITPPQT